MKYAINYINTANNTYTFWTGKKWSSEYPDAMLFDDPMTAGLVAQHLGFGVAVEEVSA